MERRTKNTRELVDKDSGLAAAFYTRSSTTRGNPVAHFKFHWRLSTLPKERHVFFSATLTNRPFISICITLMRPSVRLLRTRVQLRYTR